jgi:hypothetical protein
MRRTPWSHLAVFGTDTSAPCEYTRADISRLFLRPCRPPFDRCHVSFHEAGTFSDFETVRLEFAIDSDWARSFLDYMDHPPDSAETYRGRGVQEPCCHHGRPARRATVKAGNAKGNAGRHYFTCGHPAYSQKCDFFLFEDEMDCVVPFSWIAPDPARPTESDVRGMLAVDDEARMHFWDGVQQCTDAWYALRRRPWATASSIGYLLDNTKVEGLTIKKVFVTDSEHGTTATRHGHEKEGAAIDLVRAYLEANCVDAELRISVVASYGTWVSADGMVAVSPDGVLFVYRQRGTEVDPPHAVLGIECKAPYSSRDVHPSKAKFLYPAEAVSATTRAPCSKVYFAQVQTQMHELGLQGALFVVVSKQLASISLLLYDQEWGDRLHSAAVEWCLGRVVPLMALRNQGKTVTDCF